MVFSLQIIYYENYILYFYLDQLLIQIRKPPSMVMGRLPHFSRELEGQTVLAPSKR